MRSFYVENRKDETGHRERGLTSSLVERKIRLLAKLGLFGVDRSGAVYSRATTPRELEQAYRLVHDVYIEKKYINKHPNRLRLRHFECSPDTATFVAKTPSHGVIGVLSAVLDSEDFGLPSDNSFKVEIDGLRRKGARLCEFSNQAVLKAFREKGPSTELMRCALAYAHFKGATDLVFAVTPNVVSFYQMMHFIPIGSVRSYSDKIPDPVALVHVPDIQTRGEAALSSEDELYRFFMHYFYQGNPYFSQMPAWNLLNQRMFNEQFEVASLFSKCPEVVSNRRYATGLRRRLGEIYDLSFDATRRTGRSYQRPAWDGEGRGMASRVLRQPLGASVSREPGRRQRSASVARSSEAPALPASGVVTERLG